MENELYHWGIKKGEAAEKHKYIKREWKNNRWVYYYDTPGAKNKPAVQKPKVERKPVSKPEIKKPVKASQAVNKGISTVKSIFSTPVNSSTSKNAEAVKKRMSEAKQLVESKILNKSDGYKNLSVEAAVEPVKKDSKNNTEKQITKVNKSANDLSLIEKRKIEKQKEQEAKRKEYEASQDVERSGIRQSELEVSLKMLNKKNTWFKTYNPLPELDLKSEATTLDEDMAAINPKFSSDKDNLYNQNCAICTLAYDLRRRGYDIMASSEEATMADGKTGLSMTEISACYEGAEIVTMNDIGDRNESITAEISDGVSNENCRDVAKYMDEELLSHGEGARGHLIFVWSKGGAHDIAWEVENGKVVYRDCQTNLKINLETNAARSKDMYYIRTDNLKLTDEAMKYVRNRKDGQ